MQYGRYFLLCGAMLLSACGSGSVKETLGLTRSVPDEFRVVSRPPLSVPPQFTLRPPATAGEVAPDQFNASAHAESILMGDKAGKDTAMPGTAMTTTTAATQAKSKTKTASAKSALPVPVVTGADAQFLKNAGADQADPKVRGTLVEEQFVKQEVEENSSWWNIFSSDTEKKDPLVDAKKEAGRIKKNENDGQSVTAGETPEVKARDTGVLGRIFGY